MGRPDEAAEDGPVLLAARRGGHGQGPGGLQALQSHGPRASQERHGRRHLSGAKPQLQVGQSSKWGGQGEEKEIDPKYWLSELPRTLRGEAV